MRLYRYRLEDIWPMPVRAFAILLRQGEREELRERMAFAGLTRLAVASSIADAFESGAGARMFNRAMVRMRGIKTKEEFEAELRRRARRLRDAGSNRKDAAGDTNPDNN